MADITDLDGFTEAIGISVGDLSTRFDTAGEQLDFAADQAIDETGFTYPFTGTAKFWAIQRGKRHAIDILRTTSAYKFKYKLISLNQRFDHLDKMIEGLDEVWYKALEKDPALISIGIDIERTFGTYIGNGFIYTQDGKDVTRLMKQEYGENNDGYRKVWVRPSR